MPKWSKASAGRPAKAGPKQVMRRRPRHLRPIIQRNLGLEIEIGGHQDWRVWEETLDYTNDATKPTVRSENEEKQTLKNISDNTASKQARAEAETYNKQIDQKKGLSKKFSKKKPIPPLVNLKKLPKGIKGDPVISGNGFEVQVEDTGQESTIEFVTNAPGMHTEAQFDSTVKDMTRVGKELAQKVGTVPFRVQRGAKKFIVKPGNSFEGSLQSTVGVPLECGRIVQASFRCHGRYRLRENGG